MMIRRLVVACAAVAVCLAGGANALAAPPETAAAAKAIAYIRPLQNSDGGFPDFGSSSTSSGTIDAALAFASVGINPQSLEKDGNDPSDYLAGQAVSYSGTPGGAAKLVLALVTMDLDPTNFGTINPFAIMEANYNSGTGQYGGDTFAQSLYMLAKVSLGQSVPPAAITYTESLQAVDGSWEYCCGFGGDTNATGLVIRALLAAGLASNDSDIVDGMAYLHASQQLDGGIPYIAPGSSDPNSTAFVIQAIVAVGESLDAGGPWDAGAGATPLTYLVSTQNVSTGALQYFGFDNLYATEQGVPGLMLAAYPEQVVYVDSDADGCTDGQELGPNHVLGGDRDPISTWDFGDVPVPSLPVPGAARSGAISIADVIAILPWIGAFNGGGPNVNANDYDSDTNGNGIEDGQEYDRSPSTTPGKPWRLTAPSGAVAISDALAVLGSIGDHC